MEATGLCQGEFVAARHLTALHIRANQDPIHRPVERAQAFGMVTGSTRLAVSTQVRLQSNFGKQRSRAGSHRTESGPKFGLIQISIEARLRVGEETRVDRGHHRLLVATHASGFRKNRQHAALMTLRAVVVALAKFPTALDGYRPVATIGPEVIFEINIFRSFLAGLVAG